jgi:hypothetical protein
MNWFRGLKSAQKDPEDYMGIAHPISSGEHDQCTPTLWVWDGRQLVIRQSEYQGQAHPSLFPEYTLGIRTVYGRFDPCTKQVSVYCPMFGKAKENLFNALHKRFNPTMIWQFGDFKHPERIFPPVQSNLR